MITDNYAINNAIVDFIENQPIPRISDEVCEELAPKFDSYEAPYFIYDTKVSPITFDLDAQLSGIKSDLNHIEYVEDAKLNLSDEQIKEAATKVFAKFKKEFQENIANLSFNWAYEISDDLSIVKIMESKPDEDLMWSEDATNEFIRYVEEHADKNKDFTDVEYLSSGEIQELLDLDTLWSEFHPENQWYLFTWKRDPQTALQEIIDAIDDYVNSCDSDNVAVEVYDMYSGN